MRIHSGVLLLGLVLAASNMSYGTEHSEFNGTWRQAIYGASPTTKSKTPRELVIKLDGDTLMLTMKGPGSIHSIDIIFQIGGPEATYTGLDGDEFHIKVTRHGKSLVFDGREHEESRDLPLHEMWTLRNEGKGQVLVDTKNAKSTGEPAKVSEYERVNQ